MDVTSTLRAGWCVGTHTLVSVEPDPSGRWDCLSPGLWFGWKAVVIPCAPEPLSDCSRVLWHVNTTLTKPSADPVKGPNLSCPSVKTLLCTSPASLALLLGAHLFFTSDRGAGVSVPAQDLACGLAPARLGAEGGHGAVGQSC